MPAICATTPAGSVASEVVTIKGSVEIALAGATDWQAAKPGQVLRLNDRLRTAKNSQATVRLSDLSVIRVNELSTFQILPPASQDKKPLFDLKSGSAYFFSREKPATIEFRTPVVSGAIRGTEFLLSVAASGETHVGLLDGLVQLSNAQGEVELKSGEESRVQAGQAPTKTALINARNLIQWCLYYPAVLDTAELNWSAEEQAACRASLEAYQQGDLLRALAAWPKDSAPKSDAGREYLAALTLAVGQVDAAERELGPLTSPLAAALRKMIAAVQANDAQKAASPALATEWMAESYALQARSQLDEALQAAHAATAKSPSFGFAWARVAELEFSFGRTAKAETALARALELSPRNAQALALKGFLLSARNHFTEAESWFDRAIEADGGLANGWLGRGLCKIRRDDVDGGRADLQTAAAAEPQRALLRSYLGKAFSHAGHDHLAAKDLRLAKELDPSDPTAWLYSALLHQRHNEINEAVADLEQATALNDNRQVYRSRLLLDQDRAVSSANLASAYRDAGLTDVSVREASRAVNSDYGNHAAHLFLAESYDALRDPRTTNLRYETPWFSELLLANLLAPVGAGNLSRHISQQEYARFFDGNHLGLYSGTEYLSRGAWQQQASQYGTFGNTSYALDGVYVSDPGQRSNNDLEYSLLALSLKQQLTAKDSVFLQVFASQSESGDLNQYYNYDGSLAGVKPKPDLSLRIEEVQEPNILVGYHREWRPGMHTLALFGRLQDDFELRGTASIFALTRNAAGAQLFPPMLRTSAVDFDSDFTAYTGELQQIWQTGAHTLIAGGRYQFGEQETLVRQPTPPQQSTTDLSRGSVYAYELWQVAKPLQLIGGLSYDSLEFPENIDLPPISGGQRREDCVSPKAGFQLTPLADTVLRGAYTRSLGGLYSDSSVRLEPSQVGGFNQTFRSLIPESVAGVVPGSEFETFGLALDQKFKTRTYLTISGEILNSEADRAVGTLVTVIQPGIPATPGPGSARQQLDYQEQSLRVTVNQLAGRFWSVGASYRLTDAELEQRFAEIPTADSDTESTLHEVDLFAIFNHPCGFFAQWDTQWSRQSSRGYSPALADADFWQHNVVAGYRFWQRRAEVRLALLNLTDQDYRLNPLTLHAESPHERTLAASVRFNF